MNLIIVDTLEVHSGSTRAKVQTLHVEWNRVELPMEDSSKSSIKDAHHWSEIDEAAESWDDCCFLILDF